MSKHTPGPWKVIRRGPCGPAQESFWIGYGETEWRGPGSIVQVVAEGSARKDVVEANARLIAAAPELLQALLELREIVLDSYGTCNQLDRANAAIAKAAGGES